MDVTFREFEPYFSSNPTLLQGESEKEEVMFGSVTLDNHIQGESSMLENFI